MKRRTLLFVSLLIAVLAKAQITVEKNQMWWGYFNEADADNLPYDGYLGYGSSCTIDAAIRVPAQEEIVSGSTIKAIRFWLGTDISALSSNLRVWISTKQPTSTTVSATYRQAVSKSKLVGGLNEIELTTPFEVNHQDIWVGYTFSISKKSYPVMAYGNDAPDGFYYRIAGGTWNDFYGSGYGRLALQLLVEAESFPTNCVSVGDFGQNMVLKGKTLSIPVTFTNRGTNSVTSISYVVSSEDGSTGSEITKSFSTSPMATSGTKNFSISFSADEQARKYQKTVTVTKVNGEPNNATVGSGTGFLITLTKKETVTPVIEEFTGTWCGWCPRGMTGMEKIHETYGDQVVQIAAHSGDVMAINAYSAVINNYCDGYPGSITDRQFDGDPSFSNLKSILTSKAFKRVAQGSISLSAMWDDTEKKSLTFTTKTRFTYSEESGQYAIAYILTEDGLTGTGSDWAQQNYYNGQSGDANMTFWYSAGSPVNGLEFNHVAVAGWSVEKGVNGSVNPVIEADAEQEYKYSASISTNKLIQDKSKLKAIVLLIDRATGTVVNAAQSVIEDFSTAISSTSSEDNTPASRYALDGRMLSTPQKGINIIRMSDGTVKKVLTK